MNGKREEFGPDTPLGVALIAGLPTARAVRAAGDLETPAVIEWAIRAEERCLARSAVLGALRARLAARLAAEKETEGKMDRKGSRTWIRKQAR